mmetsp:Transcript_74964/g.216716  ORF Transcript_74964/g.216716 Transcript_74964/m.216716 type:complete len:213 (+) Transcript_74964:15-653(+)
MQHGVPANTPQRILARDSARVDTVRGRQIHKKSQWRGPPAFSGIVAIHVLRDHRVCTIASRSQICARSNLRRHHVGLRHGGADIVRTAAPPTGASPTSRKVFRTEHQGGNALGEHDLCAAAAFVANLGGVAECGSSKGRDTCGPAHGVFFDDLPKPVEQASGVAHPTALSGDASPAATPASAAADEDAPRNASAAGVPAAAMTSEAKTVRPD